VQRLPIDRNDPHGEKLTASEILESVVGVMVDDAHAFSSVDPGHVEWLANRLAREAGDADPADYAAEAGFRIGFEYGRRLGGAR
jgi:hypothetical protein